MIFSTYAAYKDSGFAPRVTVIGSGPAGVTIARTLAKMGVPVALFEAGGEDITAESQEIYEGETIGDPYFTLDTTRLRYFGGSSNHWAGWCRAIDAMDFKEKPWVPDTGWPIGRDAIEPYLSEVHDILDLVPFEDDEPVTEDISLIQLIKSPAVRFAKKYRSDLAHSRDIALVLDTYVTELAGDGTTVTGASILSAGNVHEHRSPFFVVATGGIENSRLLLWSNERSNGGVVPQAEALGRYWMEHPQFIAADVVLMASDAFPLDEQGEAFFSPSFKAIEAAGILNFGIRLIAKPYSGMKATIADLACFAPSATEWLSAKAGLHLVCGGHVSVGWEQAPDRENRIVLSKDMRDVAGVPRTELHWKKNDIDYRTLSEGLRIFGRSLAAVDAGRLRLADWVDKRAYPEDAELAGHHHMGGTRMHLDPKRGIVDADGKVHGMSNLYIGGSSIFPTSGHANPTTTITALALRLGYHLAGEVAA